MKVTVTFKTPDAIDCALEGMDKKSTEYKKAKKLLDKYIEYEEYAYLEFDVDKGTVKVLAA